MRIALPACIHAGFYASVLLAMLAPAPRVAMAQQAASAHAQHATAPPPAKAQPHKVVLARGIDDPLVDFASAILIDAYARIGMEAEDQMPTGERTLKALNAGEYFGDVIHMDGFVKMYPNLIRVPHSLVPYYAMVYTDGRSLPVKTWTDLEPYKVCILSGIKSIEISTSTLSRVTSVARYQSIFQMLRIGRCDVAVLPQSIWLKADTVDMRGIRVLEPPLQSWPLYHHIHKSNAAVLPLLTEALLAMEKSGELEARRTAFQRRVEQAQRAAGMQK